MSLTNYSQLRVVGTNWVRYQWYKIIEMATTTKNLVCDTFNIGPSFHHFWYLAKLSTTWNYIEVLVKFDASEFKTKVETAENMDFSRS